MNSPVTLPGLGLHPEMSHAEFLALTKVLGRQLGFRFPDNKHRLVAGRLAVRLRELGLDSYQAYVDRLTGADGEYELRRAVELITTNETFFFREPLHFEFLRQTVLPPLLKTGKKIRVWSAASASGQEAYSIAMVLADYLGIDGHWEVIASDVSDRVILRAKRGMYPISEVQNIAPPVLKKYCLRGNEEYEGQILIIRELRQRVNFRQANLMDPFTQDLQDLDVVFLRNVMIYFETVRKDDLIERIRQRINPGGYLIVGHAESMSVRNAGFVQIRPSIYQRE